ncbi:hypothetical protein BLGI_3881 [Brevibacillus laterosporus GI-9]|nr:hypothetical protein BLGI_3881 [Brevibacillus laterosporus GI-9]
MIEGGVVPFFIRSLLPCEVACKHFPSSFSKIGFIISNYRKQKNGVTKRVKGRAIPGT